MSEGMSRAEPRAAAVAASEKSRGSFVLWADAGRPKRFGKWPIRSLKPTGWFVYLKAEGGHRPLRHCRVLERVERLFVVCLGAIFVGFICGLGGRSP